MHLIHITFDARELKTCPQVIIPNKTKRKTDYPNYFELFPSISDNSIVHVKQMSHVLVRNSKQHSEEIVNKFLKLFVFFHFLLYDLGKVVLLIFYYVVATYHLQIVWF